VVSEAVLNSENPMLAALLFAATTALAAVRPVAAPPAPDPLASALLAGPEAVARVTDLRALADRATADLHGAARRAARADVRDHAAAALAAEVRAAGDRVHRVDTGDGRAIYRFLDRAGGFDYLLLDVSPAGRIVGWAWLSDAVDLAALDRAAAAGEWTGFGLVIDRAEDVVGQDPWLDWLRGVCAAAEGRPAEGRARMAVAEALDPSLAEQVYAPVAR
jgi:hypothetical protein